MRVRFASLLMLAGTLQWGIELVGDPGSNAIDLVLLAFPILLIVGLRKGYPLARAWTMLFAGLAVAVGLAGASIVCWVPPTPWIRIGLQIGSGVVILWGLSGLRAKEFFGLRCRCGSTRVGGYGFFLDRLRCRDCGRRWKRGDLQVDLEVFE